MSLSSATPARPLSALLTPFAAAVLLLTACGEPSSDKAAHEQETPPQAPVAEEALRLTPVGFEALPDWESDPLDGALSAFLKSCARLTPQPDDRPVGTDAAPILAGDFDAPCAAAAELQAAGAEAKRAFFETEFRPFLAANAADGSEQGLFTGYFEAELTGARDRCRFSVSETRCRRGSTVRPAGSSAARYPPAPWPAADSALWLPVRRHWH